MAVTRTVSISVEQHKFLEEYDISPSELFQDAIDEKRKEVNGI